MKEQCRDCVYKVNYKEDIRKHIVGMFFVCTKYQQLFDNKDCKEFVPKPRKDEDDDLPHERTPY